LKEKCAEDWVLYFVLMDIVVMGELYVALLVWFVFIVTFLFFTFYFLSLRANSLLGTSVPFFFFSFCVFCCCSLNPRSLYGLTDAVLDRHSVGYKTVESFAFFFFSFFFFGIF
jgi:hypothetical protein